MSEFGLPGVRHVALPGRRRDPLMTPARLKLARTIATTGVILIVSRAIGLVREFLITLAFGFTKLTDLFFQATFVPNYLLNILNGPFTTALMASLNRAPAEARAGHLRRYGLRSLRAALVVAPLFLAGGAGVAAFVGGAHGADILLTCALLAPACAAVVVIGYVAAAANACGMIARANALTTVINAIFVLGVLLIWVSGVRGQAWLLPVAFTAAALAAAALAWRWLGEMLGEVGGDAAPSPVAASGRLPGLRRGFLLALGESAAFIGTQLLVLALASHVAVGWASAATLAQRIALSVVGLIAVPVTNLAIVAAMNSPQRAPRIFRSCALALFLGSAVVAVAAHVLRAPVEAAVGGGWGDFDARSAHLLMALVPPFSLWLVAMVMNAPAARMLFGMGMGKLYTQVTLTGYAVANVVRVVACLRHDFPLAIALGAAIELVAALALCLVAYIVLARRGDVSFRDNDALDRAGAPSPMSAAAAARPEST